VPPKRLVYGITASDLNDSRNEPHGPASLMTPLDVVVQTHERPDANEWVLRQYTLSRAARLSELYSARHGLRMWASLQVEQFAPNSCPDAVREAHELRAYYEALTTGAGYAPAAGFAHQRYDIAKHAEQPLAPFEFLNKYRLGSHAKYLEKLHAWAMRHHVELILVDMPVTADLETKYPHEYQTYRAYLQHWQTRCRIIDAHRDRVGLTDAGFADMIHLNCVGAKQLSVWLQEQLTETPP
jgi:hypothetical protein